MLTKKSTYLLSTVGAALLLAATNCVAQDDPGIMEQAPEAASRQAEIDAGLEQNRIDNLERDAAQSEAVDGVDSPEAEADEAAAAEDEQQEDAAEERE